jgi:hypothetical protein
MKRVLYSCPNFKSMKATHRKLTPIVVNARTNLTGKGASSKKRKLVA